MSVPQTGTNYLREMAMTMLAAGTILLLLNQVGEIRHGSFSLLVTLAAHLPHSLLLPLSC